MEKTFTLYNGVAIPCIGYGTYKVRDASAADIVRTALECGYRHLDTARIYGNEKEVGEGIRLSTVPRDEIFLTSKVWKTHLSYDDALRSVEESLKDLQTDYLDLCLLHWPMPEGDHVDWRQRDLAAWQALERLYEEKVLRSIGVSNFLPHHLMSLLAKADVKPMVDQLEFHPGYCQPYALSFCQKEGIQIEAWSPLGRTRVLEEPLLLELAEKYGKSPAQICLRFALDNGVLPLPKSSSPERMKVNLDVFDFRLSPEDISRIFTMAQSGWSGQHPDTF